MLQPISEMRKVADYCDADDCHSDDDHPPPAPAPAERPRAATSWPGPLGHVRTYEDKARFSLSSFCVR